MSRRGSFRSSGFRSSSSRRTSASIQKSAKQSASVTESGSIGGMFGRFKRTLAENFSWGAGNQLGLQAVRSPVGEQHSQVVVVQQKASQEVDQNKQIPQCSWENHTFFECISKKGNGVSDCQSMFVMLKICEKKYS